MGFSITLVTPGIPPFQWPFKETRKPFHVSMCHVKLSFYRSSKKDVLLLYTTTFIKPPVSWALWAENRRMPAMWAMRVVSPSVTESLGKGFSQGPKYVGSLTYYHEKWWFYPRNGLNILVNCLPKVVWRKKRNQKHMMFEIWDFKISWNKMDHLDLVPNN